MNGSFSFGFDMAPNGGHSTLFKFVVEELATSNRSEARKHREWLLKRLRNTVEADGKELISDGAQRAFSRHGSAYQRTTAGDITEFDIYVVLNGTGLFWTDRALGGKGNTLRNDNLQAFKFPLSASTAAQWMAGIVHQIVKEGKDGQEKVLESKRGAKVTNFAGLQYDVIPAFEVKDDKGNISHLIPSDQGWELNPTYRDMAHFNELGDSYPREPTSKSLGFRDIVKFVKYCRDMLSLDHKPSTFVLRMAVAMAYPAAAYRDNVAKLRAVWNQLWSFVTNGFRDPYTGNQQFFDKNDLPAFDAWMKVAGLLPVSAGR